MTVEKFSVLSIAGHRWILQISVWWRHLTVILDTVGGNIIPTTKIRNNYGAIQSFYFPISLSQYWTFLYCSIPLCILFGISSLLLFWWLSFKSYRSSNYRDSDSCRSFSLLKAIAKRLPLLFANNFKSVKERQLLLSQ